MAWAQHTEVMWADGYPERWPASPAAISGLRMPFLNVLETERMRTQINVDQFWMCARAREARGMGGG